MKHETPFELDIAEQPEALRRLARSEFPPLTALTNRRWDRIVLTGMGSSHFAGLPTWRELVNAGLPAWSVDTGQLLDAPGLLTPTTAVIVTSQSGASAEVVELLTRRATGEVSPGLLVGIADDVSSPLAAAADLFVPLHSGPESTVSTKSYLNTLAVHDAVAGALLGHPWDATQARISKAANEVERLLQDRFVESYGQQAADHPHRRVVFVGWADDGATAEFAGLITKEASKVPAEGFIGGQFRHGPFELAGDGLTAVLFGSEAPSLDRLADDLCTAGARVIVVGTTAPPSAKLINVRAPDRLGMLTAGAVIAQELAVGLARGNGFVPGAFLHGSKVTTAL